MKRTLRYVGWTAIAIVAGAVLFRAAAVASRTEGGWQILREHLVAGLPPWPRDRLPDSAWHSSKQRLLDEAKRIADDPNSTADECMGIAPLLAGVGVFPNVYPDPTIVGHIVWSSAPKTPSIKESHNMDQALAKFSGELAAQATRREPQRADWWRLRALLMVWPEPYSEFDLDGLKDGALHDSDNAIYDYLLAIAKMNRAFSKKDTDQGRELYLADKELFEAGQRHYEMAAAKKLLAFGEVGYGAAAKYLRAMNAPLTDKLCWNNFLGFEYVTEELVRRIESPLDDANSRELSPAEATAFSNWIGTFFSCPKQIVMERETLWLNDCRTNSTLVNASRNVRLGRIESLLDNENRMANFTKFLSITGVATAAMAMMFLVVGLVGSVAWLIICRKRPSDRVATGFVQPTLLFALVLALTFGFLGMAPAYRPELRLYPWPIGTFLLIAFGLVGWCLWRLARFAWRQSWLKRGERAVGYQAARWILAIAGSFVFIICLFTLVDLRFREVAQNVLLKFPSNMTPGESVDYAAAEALGILEWRTLPKAALEWCYRGGAFWTAGITCVWLFWLAWRHSSRADMQPERFSRSLRYVSNSALWLALLVLLICLAVTTQSISELDTRYQRNLARLSDHAWLVKEIDAKTKRLELNVPP